MTIPRSSVSPNSQALNIGPNLLVNLHSHLCDLCSFNSLVKIRGGGVHSSKFFYIPSHLSSVQGPDYFIPACLVCTTQSALLFLTKMLSSYSSCKTHLNLTFSVKPSLASWSRACHLILLEHLSSSAMSWTRGSMSLLPLDCEHLKDENRVMLI